MSTKTVLVNNIFADSNMKHNNSEKKALFLIYEGVAEIQNMVFKDSLGIRSQGFSTLIIVDKSKVKILNMEMVGNSFRSFALVNNVKNMALSENNFKDALFTIEESYMRQSFIVIYNWKSLIHQSELKCCHNEQQYQ